MRIRHLSFSSAGGAGRAASALVALQKSYGMDSEHVFATDSNLASRPFSHPITSATALVDQFIIQNSESRFAQFSLVRNLLSSKHLNIRNGDILHLHWPAGMLSSETLRRLRKDGVGIVATLHDDFMFTGGCHSAGQCVQFQDGCRSCPYVRPVFRPVVRANARRRARTLEGSRIQISAQSEWMLDRARKSLALHGATFYRAPNVLSSHFLESPLPDPPKVPSGNSGFRAGFILGSYKDINKGLDKVARLAKNSQLDLQVDVVGIEKPTGEYPHNMSFYGKLNSQALVQLAKDWSVLLVQSKYENAPTVVSEMAAIGVPTLSTNVGAIREMMSDYGAGLTLPPEFNQADFDSCLLQLSGSLLGASRNQLAAKARKIHACKEIYDLHLLAYERALALEVS